MGHAALHAGTLCGISITSSWLYFTRHDREISSCLLTCMTSDFITKKCIFEGAPFIGSDSSWYHLKSWRSRPSGSLIVTEPMGKEIFLCRVTSKCYWGYSAPVALEVCRANSKHVAYEQRFGESPPRCYRSLDASPFNDSALQSNYAHLESYASSLTWKTFR